MIRARPQLREWIRNYKASQPSESPAANAAIPAGSTNDEEDGSLEEEDAAEVAEAAAAEVAEAEAAEAAEVAEEAVAAVAASDESSQAAASAAPRRPTRGWAGSWSEAEDFVLAYAVRQQLVGAAERSAQEGTRDGPPQIKVSWQAVGTAVGDTLTKRTLKAFRSRTDTWLRKSPDTSEAARYMASQTADEAATRLQASAARAYDAAEYAVGLAVALAAASHSEDPQRERELRDMLAQLRRGAGDGAADGGMEEFDEEQEAVEQAEEKAEEAGAEAAAVAAPAAEEREEVELSEVKEAAAEEVKEEAEATDPAPQDEGLAPPTARCQSSSASTASTASAASTTEAAESAASTEAAGSLSLPMGCSICTDEEVDVAVSRAASSGQLKLRCAAGHEFFSSATALQPWFDTWEGCPLCVVSSLCDRVGSLSRVACVDASFCVDGKHIRHNVVRKDGPRVTQSKFDEWHSCPAVPVLPESASGFWSTKSGILRVKWRCQSAGHTWRAYMKLANGDPPGVLRLEPTKRGKHPQPDEPDVGEEVCYVSARGLYVMPFRKHLLGAELSDIDCLECTVQHQKSLFAQARMRYGDRAPAPKPATSSKARDHLGKRKRVGDSLSRAEEVARTILASEGHARPTVAPAGSADAEMTIESECERILLCPPAAPPLKVLGLREEHYPTVDDVRRRFRHLAMRLHPDKCSLARAEEAFKRLSAAYRLLDTDKERAPY